MNDLQIYIYSGEQLRTTQRDDDPWRYPGNDHHREQYVVGEIVLLTSIK